MASGGIRLCAIPVCLSNSRYFCKRKTPTRCSNGFFSSENWNHCRFPRRHHGCYQKIEWRPLKNRFNGCVDGSHRRPFTMSLTNYRIIPSHQMHVHRVPNNRSNVCMRSQAFWTKSKSSSDDATYDRWFWCFCYNFSAFSTVHTSGIRTSCKWWMHSEHRWSQATPRCWAVAWVWLVAYFLALRWKNWAVVRSFWQRA